jgi:putative phosphonate metabolism protein
MHGFERYAVYYTPQGALAKAGAEWLGWDIQTGQPVAQPSIPGVNLEKLTRRPRKYGIHGTLKPPFVLAQGTTASDLKKAIECVAETLSPVSLDALEIANLGPFLALKGTVDSTALAQLAKQVVTRLDSFRAPPTDADLARRRQAKLTEAQERHLVKWGYPYVMDQFRFHITLTGRLDRTEEDNVRLIANEYFGPYLPKPFLLNSLTLAGQDSDGMFHQIERYKLS